MLVVLMNSQVGFLFFILFFIKTKTISTIQTSLKKKRKKAVNAVNCSIFHAVAKFIWLTVIILSGGFYNCWKTGTLMCFLILCVKLLVNIIYGGSQNRQKWYFSYKPYKNVTQVLSWTYRYFFFFFLLILYAKWFKFSFFFFFNEK